MFGRKNSAQLANLTYKRYFINTTIGFSSFWNFGTINLNPFCHCKVLLIKWECTKMESDESATPFLHTHKVTNAWMQAQHCWLTLHLHAETSITDKDPKTKKTTTTMTSSLRQQQCEKRVNACAMNVDTSVRKKKGVYWRGALGGGWWMRGRGKSTTSADNPNNRPHIPNLPSRQVAKRNAFATKGKTFILAGICSVVLHAF